MGNIGSHVDITSGVRGHQAKIEKADFPAKLGVDRLAGCRCAGESRLAAMGYMILRVCQFCQQDFRPSPYHPMQSVCSAADCQRRRRADYHRQRIATDPDYRKLCSESQTYWREKNPSYSKEYREKAKGRRPNGERESAIQELLRLLSRAKNNVAKNNVPPSVTRSIVEVLWVSGSGNADRKNNLAKAKIIVLEGDPNSPE